MWNFLLPALEAFQAFGSNANGRLWVSVMMVFKGLAGGITFAAATSVDEMPDLSGSINPLYVVSGVLMFTALMEVIKLAREIVREKSGKSVPSPSGIDEKVIGRAVGEALKEQAGEIKRAVELALEEQEIKRAMRIQAVKLDRLEKKLDR